MPNAVQHLKSEFLDRVEPDEFAARSRGQIGDVHPAPRSARIIARGFDAVLGGHASGGTEGRPI
jgi:hypothetical protein